MTEAKDNSSLPLLLSITGAVLVVAIGGWFFLDQEPSAATAPQSRSIVEPDATTVTEIATRWGFYELGRFAVDFRRLFNELPSEVLKRAPSRAARRIPRREA